MLKRLSFIYHVEGGSERARPSPGDPGQCLPRYWEGWIMETRWSVRSSPWSGGHWIRKQLCIYVHLLTISGYKKYCPDPVVFSSPCICPWRRSDAGHDPDQWWGHQGHRPRHGECLPDPGRGLEAGTWHLALTCWRGPQRAASQEISGHC